MGEIRKQAILSGIVIYIGFGIGFVNTWLFIRNGQGYFTPAQYGLTRLFFDVGSLMFAVASLGILPVINKFFPYYQEHLPRSKNDLFAKSLLIALTGFLLVLAGGLLFEPLIVRKFSERSELFVEYFHWVFLFGAGILMFSVLETISISYRQSVLPNFLRETAMRLLTMILLFLFITQTVSFDQFISLFSFQFLAIAFILFIVLKLKKQLPLTLKPSLVTKRFKKKMFTLGSYVYGGLVISILSQVIDSILIASISEKGIHDAGVYNLATYLSNLIQVPQRSIITATLPILVLAWKNKNMSEIDRLYKRSSINLLLIGLFIFFCIWMNVSDIFDLLNIQSDYKAGMYVILILGITKLIDAGTGINGQIIATSSYWRFEFFTGIILVLLILPLNYILINKYGIIGSAYANLLSFSVYNLIRYLFLWKKHKIQPFTVKTVYSIAISFLLYFIADKLFGEMHSWSGLFIRTGFFTMFFVTVVFVFKLTPDALQLWHQFRKRFKNEAN